MFLFLSLFLWKVIDLPNRGLEALCEPRLSFQKFHFMLISLMKSLGEQNIEEENVSQSFWQIIPPHDFFPLSITAIVED